MKVRSMMCLNLPPLKLGIQRRSVLNTSLFLYDLKPIHVKKRVIDFPALLKPDEAEPYATLAWSK
jgi:hypothetical protein